MSSRPLAWAGCDAQIRGHLAPEAFWTCCGTCQDRFSAMHGKRRECFKCEISGNHSYCRELTDLSPSRSGVPFEEQFTQVWHYVFGAANRILIEAGWLADPYRFSPARRGYIPTVFDGAIQQ